MNDTKEKNGKREYYAGQKLPYTSSPPKCPECGSDQVSGIFYGSTPSGGHDDRGNPVPPDKPFHPCREFAETLKRKNIVLAIDADINYRKLYKEARSDQENYIATRPLWHCNSCNHNFNKYD